MTKAVASETGKGKGRFWIFVILTSCFLVFLMPALLILVLVGMLPTLVAGFVERHGLGRVQVTATLNLAGVLPFVTELWSSGGSFGQLMDMASSVYTWATMYGAAFSAIIYLWIGPYLAASYLDFKAARAIHYYEKQKTQLLEDWGDALTAEPAKEKPDTL